MKFAIAFANTGPFINPDKAVAMAQAAEAAGFESLWTVEHVVVPADYQSPYPYSDTGKMPGGDDSPIPDPLIWLTYVAAATKEINLATGILILPQRNPVVLAKELATLDFMSNGRMLLGTGVGWMKEEFDAIGVPFNERGKRNDENIAAMRALWSEDKASITASCDHNQSRALSLFTLVAALISQRSEPVDLVMASSLRVARMRSLLA
jgi:probable F420-dependent oxidoreductase